ncbi:hypothetical protein J5J83_00045 [Azoarcus sp. L1K30]|uniref:hypothetical protein n=1 Tax=Azoarcus sp. L1K30 TaxID=2820277 RepID=UPI001B810728|nr:hypothetical protein [Azoarcus sp. L1K30]MBR0564500.1 hypothetical protein [Azoarcus sp. L1K30]
MKPRQLLVPLVLAGSFTTAAAAPMLSAANSGVTGIVVQNTFGPALPPMAMVSLPAQSGRSLQSGSEASIQATPERGEEGDFTLGLAGALMVGMVVIKRFSR